MFDVVRTLKTLIILFALVSLAGCVDVPIVGQGGYGESKFDLYGERRVGQEFFSTDRNLKRIDIWLNPSRALKGKDSVLERREVLGRLTGKNVIFRLYELPPGSIKPTEDRRVLTLRLPTRKIRNASLYQLSFKPLPDSQRRRYLLELRAPDLSKDLAVSVGITRIDRYSEGRAILNGVPADGRDLRFLPFIRMNARMVASSAYSRLRADTPFTLFWLGLVGLTGGATIWLWRRAGREDGLEDD